MPSTLAVLIHVADPAWARRIESELDILTAPVHPFDLGPGQECRLHPSILGSRKEFAQHLMELVHRGDTLPVLVISDQLYEHGQATHLLKVARSACMSHGRLSSLISLDANPTTSTQPFLNHVNFAAMDMLGLRAAIELAATRLQLLGAPDQSGEFVAKPARYVVRPVADVDVLRSCLALRHKVYRHIGYLSPEVANSPTGLDIDYHDGMSLHLAAIDTDTGQVAGTTRVVIPHRMVNELVQVRREFTDVLRQQKSWIAQITDSDLDANLRARVQLPGCAPLPMLTYVQDESNYGELLSKAAVGAELSRFAVDPRYRGDGISRLLAHVALSSALELEREMLFLECLPHFAQMYKKYGFVEISDRSAYLDADSMSLLYDSMVCPLSGTSRFIESLKWDAELLHMMTETRISADALASESREVVCGHGSHEYPIDISSPAPQFYTSPLFDCSVPSYVLDQSYRIIDWNPSFYELFARPHGLRRGMHVTVFLTAFVNVEEVTARSLKVFAPGNNPMTDSERLLIRHPVYGVVHAQKHASQLLSETGAQVGWLVSFHIVDWDNRDQPLFDRMMASLGAELAWEQLALSTEPLFAGSQAFREVVDLVTTSCAANDEVLLIGLGPADIASALLSKTPGLTVQEPNQRLVDRWLGKVASAAPGTHPRVVKAERNELGAYTSGRFQRIVIPWSRLRGADWPSWSEIRRVLSDDGECLLVLPDNAGMFELIEHLSDEAQLAIEPNARQSLGRLATAWSDSTTVRLLGSLAESGFETFHQDTACDDKIFILRCQKSTPTAAAMPLARRHQHR